MPTRPTPTQEPSTSKTTASQSRAHNSSDPTKPCRLQLIKEIEGCRTGQWCTVLYDGKIYPGIIRRVLDITKKLCRCSACKLWDRTGSDGLWRMTQQCTNCSWHYIGIVRQVMDVMKYSMVPVHAVVRQNMLWWALKVVDHFRWPIPEPLTEDYEH